MGKKFVRKKNPFKVSILTFTTICCVALCIVFGIVIYFNNKTLQETYIRSKAELIVDDFENQVELMEEVSCQVASSYEFAPYYFKKDIGRELSMLDQFKQYGYTLLLTEEYFVYYGEKFIYLSTGNTYDYERYLSKVSVMEEERLLLENTVSAMREDDSVTGLGRAGTRLLALQNDIYVLVPIRVNGEKEKITAIVGFIIDKNILENRFQIVSGGLEGTMSLYGDEVLLYANQDIPVSTGQKNVITANSSQLRYSFCCLPEINVIYDSYLTLQLFSILVIVTLIYRTSYIFAERMYRPIVMMSNKYREQYPMQEVYSENALKEIEFMLDEMNKSNMESKRNIREQILQSLIEGSYSSGILISLDREELYLPGPYYFVISILYGEKVANTEVLDSIRNELEQLGNEKNHIYTVCNYEKKIISVINSIFSEEETEEIVESVHGVAERFSDYVLGLGVGSVYQILSSVAASWLESLDNLYDPKEKNGNDSKEIQKITVLLESGNQKEALKRMECYLEEMKNMSFLMQKYIMVEFLSEVKRLGDKYHMVLSNQSLSMILTAKNMQEFEIASKNLLRSFSEEYAVVKGAMHDEKMAEICDYIEEHFSEYDISLENTASALGVDTASVREAVMQKMGIGYKEYLVYLRIEYAKKLLRNEKISVAAVCEKIGYGNVSHFIKIFKEMTGVTPAKFGQMNKK